MIFKAESTYMDCPRQRIAWAVLWGPKTLAPESDDTCHSRHSCTRRRLATQDAARGAGSLPEPHPSAYSNRSIDTTFRHRASNVQPHATQSRTRCKRPGLLRSILIITAPHIQFTSAHHQRQRRHATFLK